MDVHCLPDCNDHTQSPHGADHAAADVSSLGGDGAADVYAWGGNQFGQLGLGDTVAKVIAEPHILPL